MSNVFYLSVKWQEETNYTSQIFFLSLYKIERFPLKFCVAMTTPVSTWTELFSNLELTNVFFLMEIFFLSYVNELYLP